METNPDTISQLIGTDNPNNFVFRMEGTESQERSSLQPPSALSKEEEPMSASKKKRMKQKAKKMEEKQILHESLP